MRKQAKLAAFEALRTSEARYRALANLAPVGIFYTDAQGLVTYVNKKWCEIGGITPEAAMGTGWLDGLHPDDRERTAAKWNAFARDRTTFRNEYRYQRPDGVTAHCYVQALPEFDADGNLTGYIGCVTDISERKHAEEVLRLSETRLTEAQKIAHIGSWGRNLDSGEVWWSDETYRIFGYAPQQFPVTFERFGELIHPDDRRRFIEADKERLETRGSFHLEYRIVRPDSLVRHVDQQGKVSCDATGNPISVSGTIQDITERKELETQLHEAQKLEALGQLTGGVAHEFNNLLQVIVGSLDIIDTEVEGNDRAAQMIAIAQRSVFKGKEMTDRLLSYVGRQPLKPEVIDVGDFVGEVVEQLDTTLGETIEVETRIPDDLWPIRVDQEQLRNALFNLATNARDAMPDGGTIVIEAANIRIDDAYAAKRRHQVTPGDYVELAVTDTGTGISTEVKAQIFDPFFTTKEIGRGTGVGLSMVYGFVTRQSGGFIDIDSEEGRGTRLALYLPRA